MFTLLLLLSTIFQSTISQAAVSHADIPGRMPTKLSPTDLTREALDFHEHPHFMAFLKTVDLSKGIRKSDPRNAHLIPTPIVFTPTQEMWDGVFKAAAADHLTCLRAFALLSREIKRNGVIVFGPGKDFEKAVADNHVDLGLALPAHNIGTAIWAPDPGNSDPEFQLHLKVFYTESYIHHFPDNILPANLKIGYGKDETYFMDGQEYHQHTIEADIYDGPTKGVGFRNVKGVGGQKRGFLGFVQKVFFFLPDAVDSMTIHEDKDTMVTEAMVNTVVKNFEKDPLYSIKIVQP